MVYESGFGLGVEATLLVLSTNDTYLDRQANFGPRLAEGGLEGHLIPLSDLHHGTVGGSASRACQVTNVTVPEDWVALVERGDCSFITKVRNLQQMGAKAVVVGDPDRNSLVVMYATGDTSDVKIPSVFIAQTQYRELSFLAMMAEEPLAVVLSADELLDWPLRDVLLIVILSPTLVMIFIFMAWRMRVYQHRKKELAPVTFVNSLPTKTFIKEKRKQNEPEECVICIEEFQNDALIRILPCGHEYHVACIDGWLTRRKKFCPICKRDITQPTETTPLLGQSGASVTEDSSV